MFTMKGDLYVILIGGAKHNNLLERSDRAYLYKINEEGIDILS